MGLFSGDASSHLSPNGYGRFPWREVLATVCLLLTATVGWAQDPQPRTGVAGEWAVASTSPLVDLPDHIRRITHFGQRGHFSDDGERVLFIEKTFGDVFEVDLGTGAIRPLTHHFHHEGFVRARYLSNGDILLAGSREFDAENPWPSRHVNAELWVLDDELDGPPHPLGVKANEGQAVSTTELRIAWSIDGRAAEDLPEMATQIWTARIAYEDTIPRLVDRELVLDSRDRDLTGRLETQDFRLPEERELIFTHYAPDYSSADVMGLDLRSGALTHYTDSEYYQEPEGIFSHDYTLIEGDLHSGAGMQQIDIYRLALDGSGRAERVTFFNEHAGYKASNPSVSPSGDRIVFQMAHAEDPAGFGRGLFIYDVEAANRADR